MHAKFELVANGDRGLGGANLSAIGAIAAIAGLRSARNDVVVTIVVVQWHLRWLAILVNLTILPSSTVNRPWPGGIDLAVICWRLTILTLTILTSIAGELRELTWTILTSIAGELRELTLTILTLTILTSIARELRELTLTILILTILTSIARELRELTWTILTLTILTLAILTSIAGELRELSVVPRTRLLAVLVAVCRCGSHRVDSHPFQPRHDVVQDTLINC